MEDYPESFSFVYSLECVSQHRTDQYGMTQCSRRTSTNEAARRLCSLSSAPRLNWLERHGGKLSSRGSILSDWYSSDGVRREAERSG